MKPPLLHQAAHLFLLAMGVFLIAFAAIQGLWMLLAVGAVLTSLIAIGVWNSWRLWRKGVDPTANQRAMSLFERIMSDLERPNPFGNVVGWVILIAAIVLFLIDENFSDALIIVGPVLVLSGVTLLALIMRRKSRRAVAPNGFTKGRPNLADRGQSNEP
jgi:hypothetical protein